MTQTKNEDAGGVGVGPEKNNFAAGFENAVEFAKDAVDFLIGEVLHHTEIVDAVELFILKWHFKDAPMDEGLGVFVISGIQAQGAFGNIQGRDFHFALKRCVHLAASAACVQQGRSGFKLAPDGFFKVSFDNPPAIETCYGFINWVARLTRIVPIGVPVLRVGDRGVQWKFFCRKEKLLGAANVFDGKLKYVSCTIERGLGGHLRIAVGAGWKGYRNLIDRKFVAVKNKHAFEKEGIALGLDEAKNLRWNPVQSVNPEGSTRILGYAENKFGESMTQKSHRAAEDVPTGETVSLNPPGTYCDIGTLGSRDDRGNVGWRVCKVAIKSN